MSLRVASSRARASGSSGSEIATTRWGHFVTARRASPQPGLFAGFGYLVLKKSTTTGYRFGPFYILFGRKSLVNPGPVIG